MKQLRSTSLLILMLLVAVACASPSPTPPVAPIKIESTPATTATQSPPAIQPAPTNTATLEPIPIPSAMPTSPPTAQPTPCGPPPGWPAYTIQAGDTLFSIAYNTGTSVDQLKLANCLVGDTIYAGQALFVPFAPYIPPALPTILPGPTFPVPTLTIDPGKVPQPPPPSPTGAQPVTPEPTVRVPRLTPAPRSGPKGTVFTISLENFQANEDIIVRVTHQATGQVVLTQSVRMDLSGSGAVPFDSQSSQSVGLYILMALRGAEPVAFEQLEISQ